MLAGAFDHSRKSVYDGGMSPNAATAQRIRSSNAAGPHPDRRTRRRRTRRDARHAAVQDSRGNQ